jgi:ubiquinone/menaquinone biosynthesis C-methylase UbiE
MHTHSHRQQSPAQTEGRLIRWAPWYDTAVSLMTFGLVRRLRALTIEHSLITPGDSVLDVGCGTGGVTLPARLRAGNQGAVAGIDPAPEMIAVARRKARRAGLEIDFRVGVIEALPFPDQTFDVVTSSLMMHHLPRQVQIKGLAEIGRVLKPGGRLLVADMMRPGTSPLKRFFTSAILHHGHAMHFGIEDLPALLQATGFEQIELLDDQFLMIGFARARRPAF